MADIWTIGHSTREVSEFIGLLRAQQLQLLLDVRRYPMSRRHPQFHADALRRALETAGLHYRHMADLGGRRTPRPDSINRGWRNAGFRGYADYMSSTEFLAALAELMSLADSTRACLMCAEAVPWRCHRLLLSDALVSRGWTVRHVLSPTRVDLHTLTDFARVDGDRITYPLHSAGQPALF